jgi:hypothetical protein
VKCYRLAGKVADSKEISVISFRAMEEVNSAFVGDDGQLEDIGGPVTSPKTPSVKYEIDYSTATKRSQIGAALAGKNCSYDRRRYYLILLLMRISIFPGWSNFI